MTGKLVQDHEYVYPYYRLQEAGYEVDVAVRGGDIVYGILGTKVVPNKDVEDVRVKDYALLVLPGGAKAMEYMRQDEGVIRFVKDAYDAGIVIASICHAAQLLISARVVEGKKVSGYYSIKDDINNAGATYVDASVVVDEGIVSSPHYKYLGAWMGRVLEEVKAWQ